MKKILLLSCLLLGLAASSAMASGMSFAWFECFGGGSGAAATNWNFACTSNADILTPQGGPPYYLVPAFDPANPLPAVTATTTVINIEVTGATLPNWWQLTGCRGGAYSVIEPTAASLVPDCNTLFPPAGPGQSFGTNPVYTAGFGGANKARMLTDLASQLSVPVTPGTQYYPQIVTLTQAKTTGIGSCAGCAASACLVLNQVELYQVAGSPGGDVIVITNNIPGALNYITWQGGTTGCPGSTPTKNATWGSIKALYR